MLMDSNHGSGARRICPSAQAAKMVTPAAIRTRALDAQVAVSAMAETVRSAVGPRVLASSRASCIHWEITQETMAKVAIPTRRPRAVARMRRCSDGDLSMHDSRYRRIWRARRGSWFLQQSAYGVTHPGGEVGCCSLTRLVVGCDVVCTRQRRRRISMRIRRMLPALLAACISWVVVPPAMAVGSAADSMEENSTVSVVAKTWEDVPISDDALARSEVSIGPVVIEGVVPLPREVELSVGERLTVEYADGLVVHEQLAASCTVSLTVYNPKKTNNQAQANHSISVSSGCSSNHTATGRLLSYTGLLGWSMRSSRTSTGYPGSTTVWTTSEPCATGTSTKWQATTGLPVVATSAEVTLACRG